jgi:hypothetical protein
MFELMPSTRVRNIDNIDASLVRTVELASMNNTLGNRRLCLEETLKVYSFGLLFSHVNEAAS